MNTTTKAQRHNKRKDHIWERFDKQMAAERSKGESAPRKKDAAPHTPGPWSYSGINTDMYIMARRGHERIYVAEVICNDDRTPDETDANKALIAAAPETAAERDRLRAQRDELLAACKAAFSDTGATLHPRIVAQMSAAIQHAQEAQ